MDEKVVGPLAPIDRLFFQASTPTTRQQIAALSRLDRDLNESVFRARMPGVFQRFPRFTWSVRNNRWQQTHSSPSEIQNLIAQQVQKKIVPHALSEAQFEGEVGRVFSQPMPLEHPLWRITILTNGREGSEGKHALLNEFHHAFTDGVGGLEMIDYLFAGTRESSLEISAERENWSRGGKRSEDKTVPPTRLVSEASLRWFREFLRPAKKTIINGRNSSERRIVHLNFPLDALRRAKRQHQVSLNDVVFTVLARAVQQLDGVEKLKFLVPVSLRLGSERFDLGNHLSAVGVEAPPYVDDFATQVTAVNQRFQALKTSGSLETYARLANKFVILPSALHRPIFEFQSKRTNAICTNMPGPMRARYVAGAQVTHQYGYAALVRSHGAAFGFISFDGKLCTAIVTDPAVIPDPSILKDALAYEFSQIGVTPL